MAQTYNVSISNLNSSDAAYGDPYPGKMIKGKITSGTSGNTFVDPNAILGDNTIWGGNQNPDWTWTTTTQSNFDLAQIAVLEEKVKELEKKLRAEKRKKINNIEIESLQQFHFFMTTLLEKLKAHLGEEDKLHDNLEFLIDELVVELDKMLNGQSET